MSEIVTPATTIKNVMLLSLCISVGIGLVSEYAGMCTRDGEGKIVKDGNGRPVGICPPIDLEQFIDESDAEARNTADPDGFDPVFNFGDFLRITQAIINGMAFQYFISTLEMLGFNSTFVLGMRAIGAGYMVYAVYYLISNRNM